MITTPETHASLLLLAATAAGPLATPDPLEYTAQMLWEAGYQSTDGTHITPYQARQAAADTHLAIFYGGGYTSGVTAGVR